MESEGDSRVAAARFNTAIAALRVSSPVGAIVIFRDLPAPREARRDGGGVVQREGHARGRVEALRTAFEGSRRRSAPVEERRVRRSGLP